MSPRLQLTEPVAGARLLGLGSFQPERVVTNDELAARVETSDEWIRARVGIESRRIADKDTLLVDMAADAGARAIEDSGLEMSEIGAVIKVMRQSGVGVLLVEHHTDFVFRISDRVTTLDVGAVIKHGTPDEVKRDPEVIRVYLGA